MLLKKWRSLAHQGLSGPSCTFTLLLQHTTAPTPTTLDLCISSHVAIVMTATEGYMEIKPEGLLPPITVACTRILSRSARYHCVFSFQCRRGHLSDTKHISLKEVCIVWRCMFLKIHTSWCRTNVTGSPALVESNFYTIYNQLFDPLSGGPFMVNREGNGIRNFPTGHRGECWNRQPISVP